MAAEGVLAAGTKAAEVVRAVGVAPVAGAKVAATAAEVVLAAEGAPVAGMRAAATAAAEVAPAVAFIGLPITAEAATGRADMVADLRWGRSAIISAAGHTFIRAEAAARSAKSLPEQ